MRFRYVVIFIEPEYSSQILVRVRFGVFGRFFMRANMLNEHNLREHEHGVKTSKVRSTNTIRTSKETIVFRVL